MKFESKNCRDRSEGIKIDRYDCGRVIENRVI